MDIRWSNQRAIANSKIVKMSAIWFVIVPLAAKILSRLDDVIKISIFQGNFKFITTLPFSWQLLFFAACFFTVAGVVYSVFCPEIVKSYSNYTEFENDGKSRLQINYALKKIVWDTGNSKIKPEYLPIVKKYFDQYGGDLYSSVNDIKENAFELFDDLTNIKGKNSNAFYFVYLISDIYRYRPIKTSLFFYLFGFICIGVIAIENIVYVLKSFG